MRRQIRGVSQGVKNTQDGISMCQVADGTLSEASEMIHRITELSVKAANGTPATSDSGFSPEQRQRVVCL